MEAPSLDKSRVLVADIGGTHIRLAMAAGGLIDPATARRYAGCNFKGPSEAAEHYLLETGLTRPDAACLALAAPVEGRQIPLTNSDWVVDADTFETRLGVSDCRLINDFEALAYALPSLSDNDLVAVGGGAAQPGNRAVLGPGTGLGVATLAGGGGNAIAIPGEGGHVSFAPVDELEIEILRFLTRIHGRVSAERLISGPGLESLHKVLAEIDGSASEARSAREVVETALADSTSSSRRTIDVFCGILGAVAGDIALVVGARSGIYLAGGIASGLSGIIADTPFRSRFDAKGRLSFYVNSLPVWVITGPYAGLTGAAAAHAFTTTCNDGRN